MSSGSSVHEPLHRRLSARRGSVSAPDPWARNIDAETERATTSRLTIVRVPSAGPSPPPPRPDSPHSSGGNTPARRSSWGSQGSHGRGRSSGSASPGGGKRLSFAFSTFTPIKPAPDVAPPPLERVRTNSSGALAPLLNRRPGATLTPQELIELAQNPMAGATSPNPVPGAMVPAPFTPLDDDHFLPFLDRPAEVAALLSTPPTSRLFALLCQAFPAAPDAPVRDPLPEDPSTWSGAQLTHWLTRVTRDAADDRVWVEHARACVSPRSELIWECLKGALGVPPELDESSEEDEDADAEEGYDDEALDGTATDDDDAGPETWVEPIYAGGSLAAPSAEHFATSPVHSDGGFSGMEAIGEREEEITPAAQGQVPSPPSAESPIHGIRIHAAPLPVPPAYTRASSFSEPGVRASFSDRASVAGVRRAASSAARLDEHYDFGRGAARTRRAASASHTLAAGFGGAMRMHAPHLERAPGNPLFVSSFANLSVGPTLVANNPAHRAYASFAVPAPSRRSVRFDAGPSKLGPGGILLRPPVSSSGEYALSATSESERDFGS